MTKRQGCCDVFKNRQIKNETENEERVHVVMLDISLIAIQRVTVHIKSRLHAAQIHSWLILLLLKMLLSLHL